MSARGGKGESRSVPVQIFGQAYTLRTEDDPAHVEALAAYVDERMREVADRTRTADTVKIAILAALNVADELHRLRRQGEEEDRELEERAAGLADLLDAALAS